MDRSRRFQFGSRSLLDPDPVDDEGAEKRRVGESDRGEKDWKRWGPYVSERQWGTCREDYGLDGNSWEYVTFQNSHQVAYRWGEDGIAGFCDIEQRLCLSLALWNGRDPILKERLFGLSGPQGNHGEDVKDMYYYLDATPSHSYLKMLYKYPQNKFPYDQIRRESAKLGALDPEYELMDTGIFDDNRYFDVFVEYARDGVDDILMRVTAHNRGRDAADLRLLPQLVFRNTWSWKAPSEAAPPRPCLRKSAGGDCVEVDHPSLGKYFVYVDGSPSFLFCENETNAAALASDDDLSPFDFDGDAEGASAPDKDLTSFWTKLYGSFETSGGPKPKAPYRTKAAKRVLYQATGHTKGGPFKDAFHRYVVQGKEGATAPSEGTKAAFLSKHTVPPGASVSVRLRLCQKSSGKPFDDFDAVFKARIDEADSFYAGLQAGMQNTQHQLIERQALAGMIWTKQFYYYDLHTFFAGDSGCAQQPEERKAIRNIDWDHMANSDIISMPDKWEFPWYATWDLAFHCLPLALVDPAFAKNQLLLMTRERYMHPNGQLPAFEWNFSDVNPPVHAWASWRVFQMDRKQRGDAGDLNFLQDIFHKLTMNFMWWVNRKDAEGRNIFQGGFLGLDNIGVFDRGGELPTGGFINQSDGTSWMAFFSLNLMRMALELALHNPVYENMASKFFEHFLHIARAMTMLNSGQGLWDETDEFYYDVLTLPGGDRVPLRVRSMVGLIPLFAVEILEPSYLEKLPRFAARMTKFLEDRPDLAALISQVEIPGHGECRLLSLLRGDRVKCLLKRMLDPTEFLSDFGVRALSRSHLDKPYVLERDGKRYEIGYEPAEATVRIMGGNSNWRGPIWFPMNYLIIESLQKFHQYYGDDYKVECPTNSGIYMSILSVADEVGKRLTRLFEPGPDGKGRPALRLHEKMATDPHFRDYVLFYEHFHGDSGRGVGASHQTGWTGLVAKVIQSRYAETRV